MRHRRHLTLPAVAVVCAAHGSPAGAQPAGVSVGAGIGVDAPTSAASGVGRDRTVVRAVVGVAPRRGPLEWRGAATWRLGNGDTGPVSLVAHGLLPVTAARFGETDALQVMVAAGAGAYGVGSVGHTVGPTVGAGVRFQSARLAASLESERHWATRSYVGVFTVSARRP
jgi:hypothetical protein